MESVLSIIYLYRYNIEMKICIVSDILIRYVPDLLSKSILPKSFEIKFQKMISKDLIFMKEVT
jgi:hypothetical protein